MNLAFGVAAALFRRERTGSPPWSTSRSSQRHVVNSSDIIYSKAMGRDFTRR